MIKILNYNYGSLEVGVESKKTIERSKCPMYHDGLCDSCVLIDHLSTECCFFDCFVLGSICDCRKCFFRFDCPYFDTQTFEDKLEALLDNLGKTYYFRNVATIKDIPSSFIPEIKLSKKNIQSLEHIKEIGLPVIALSLQEIVGKRNPKKLSRKTLKMKKQGLHRFLKYDGKIILTLDIRDHLCNSLLKDPQYYVNLFNELSPDIITTFDTYSYLNIPAAVSMLKLLDVYSANAALTEFDGKVVGIQLGSTLFQLLFFTKLLVRQGLRIVAVPSYSLRKQNLNKLIQMKIDIVRSFKQKALVLSCGPGLDRGHTIFSDFYSNFSWFSSEPDKDARINKLKRLTSLAKKHATQMRFEKNSISDEDILALLNPQYKYKLYLFNKLKHASR